MKIVITYTQAAKKELVEFQQRQQALLEELVSDRKAVFGDESIEITASDIKEVARCIQPIRLTRLRFSVFIITAYIVVGVIMMVGAFIYPEIQVILENNKTQGHIFLLGAIMTALGGLAKYWLKVSHRHIVNFEIKEKLRNLSKKDGIAA